MHSHRTFIIKIIFRSLSEKLISRGDQRVTILAEMIEFFANDHVIENCESVTGRCEWSLMKQPSSSRKRWRTRFLLRTSKTDCNQLSVPCLFHIHKVALAKYP